MNTDDPNQQMPPMKHTNIQPQQDIYASIMRALREQEDRLDRLSQIVKSIDDHLDSVGGALEWHEYLMPFLIGILIGTFIGWTI